MSKRIVSSILGAIGLFAGLIAGVFTIEGAQDFTNPAVPFRLAVLGELLMCSMSLAALIIGVRFLRFAWRGRNDRSSSWLKTALLGFGCFFPGVLFSLPLTIFWARYTWPGDGQAVLAAIEVSLYIGIAAAIICSAVLFKKRHTALSLSK
jgi:hypothetical protein